MPEINNPHDRGYKSLLASEKIFLELLESFIEMGWVSQIDRNAITRIDTTYILPDFSEKEADLVYRLKIKNQEVIFYLLLELQSTVDFQMSYRLLVYMMGIWRDVLKNIPPEEAAKKDFRLPSIVPIVLYNGRDKWTACRSFKDILAASELFKEYLVDFKYILIDVNRYDERTLTELTNLIGAVFLLDQSENFKEYCGKMLKIVPNLSKFNENDFLLFKNWIKLIFSMNLPTEAKHEIVRILDESRPEEALKMVTNIEKVIGNVYEEGINDGKMDTAKKMLAKNMPEELINEITGLPVEQIRKLKSELH